MDEGRDPGMTGETTGNRQMIKPFFFFVITLDKHNERKYSIAR